VAVKVTVCKDPSTVPEIDPHENVIQVKESFYEPLYSYDILEYIPSGSLVDYSGRIDGPIPESTARKIIKSLICGLLHLSVGGFRAKDLNPQNILILGEDPPTPIVSDFVYAPHDKENSSDVQALGSVALYMFTREVPSFHLDILPLIDVVPGLHISRNGRSFIEGLLDTRLSISGAQTHPWLVRGDEDEGNTLED